MEAMSVCFISTLFFFWLFFFFPPDSGSPRRPRADVSYFRKEHSPPIPERFLKFLYLTKISYREKNNNCELGAHGASGSRWFLSFPPASFCHCRSSACCPVGSMEKNQCSQLFLLLPGSFTIFHSGDANPKPSFPRVGSRSQPEF